MPRLIEVRSPKFKGPSDHDPTQEEVAVGRNVYAPKIGVVSKRPGFARQYHAQYRGAVSLLRMVTGVCGYIRDGILLIAGTGVNPSGDGGIVQEDTPGGLRAPHQSAPANYPNDEFEGDLSLWDLTEFPSNPMLISGGEVYPQAGAGQWGSMAWVAAPQDDLGAIYLRSEVAVTVGSSGGEGWTYLQIERNGIWFYAAVQSTSDVGGADITVAAGGTGYTVQAGALIAGLVAGDVIVGTLELRLTDAGPRATFVPTSVAASAVQVLHSQANSGDYEGFRVYSQNTNLGERHRHRYIRTSY